MFRTKAQHHACEDCPIAKTADLVGDSTILLIVRDLKKTPRRFSELTTSLPAISTRTLSEKLKKLETEGLIERTEYAEFPPRVEYSLTKKGKGLSTLMNAMKKYGEEYLDE